MDFGKLAIIDTIPKEKTLLCNVGRKFNKVMIEPFKLSPLEWEQFVKWNEQQLQKEKPTDRADNWECQALGCFNYELYEKLINRRK